MASCFILSSSSLLLLFLLCVNRGVNTNETSSESPAESAPPQIDGRSIPLIVFDNQDTTKDCVTPDSKKGACGPLKDCPMLHGIRNLNALRKYICGYEGRLPLLCCPRESRTTTRPPNRATNKPSSKWPVTRQPSTPPPLPSELRARKPQLLPDECGITNTSFTRIVGGVNAKRGDWPWQALVYMKDRNGQFDTHCGASLISHRHLLSAAHCFVLSENKVSDASLFKVRLGEHDLSNPSNVAVERYLTRIVTHENFEYGLNTNDIAIMFMDNEVPFNKYVYPVCLPYSKNIISDNITTKYTFVTGWGRTRYLGKTSEILQVASFPIWDSKRCSDVFKSIHIEHVDDKRFICAGDETGVQDACQGDSGGPLVRPEGYSPTRYYQVGIVSFGVRCSTKGFPGVYTRITSYLDWINKHVS